LALTYLLKKNAASSGCSRRERLLAFYFKTLWLMASAQHLLKLNEKRAVLKLPAILRYFASFLGERVAGVQFSDLAA